MNAAALSGFAGPCLLLALVAVGLAALLEQSAEGVPAGPRRRGVLPALPGLPIPVAGPSAARGRFRPGRPGPAGVDPPGSAVGLLFLAVVPQFLPSGGSVVQAALASARSTRSWRWPTWRRSRP